jgi:hypothetical protein
MNDGTRTVFLIAKAKISMAQTPLLTVKQRYGNRHRHPRLGLFLPKGRLPSDIPAWPAISTRI